MRQCDQRKPSLCAVVVFGRKSAIDCESNCNKFSRSHRFKLVSLHAVLAIFKFAPRSTCLGLDYYRFNPILQHARPTTSVHSKNAGVFPIIAAYKPRWLFRVYMLTLTSARQAYRWTHAACISGFSERHKTLFSTATNQPIAWKQWKKNLVFWLDSWAREKKNHKILNLWNSERHQF